MDKIISNITSNKKAFIVEHHSFVRSGFLLISTIALGLTGILMYHNDRMLDATVAFLFAFMNSIEFYYSKSHYSLQFPKTSTANKLFKVKDVYFVGTCLEEAQLFASFYDVDASQVEQVQDAQAFKFD